MCLLVCLLQDVFTHGLPDECHLVLRGGATMLLMFYCFLAIPCLTRRVCQLFFLVSTYVAIYSEWKHSPLEGRGSSQDTESPGNS